MDAAYIIKFLNSVGAPDMAEEVAAMHNRLEAFSSRLDVAAMDCAIKAAEEAIKQRDVLLAALEQIANESTRNLGSARIIARAALASAKGGAA